MKKIFFMPVTILSFIFLLFTLRGNAQWQQIGLNSSNVGSIVINGNNIFAGTYQDGIFLSSNNGGSWTAVNTGLPNPIIIWSLAVKGDTILAGSDGAGIFFSINNGNSWDTMNIGLPYIDGAYYGIMALAVKGDTIFASTFSDGIFRSLNNGSSWDSINTGLTGTAHRLVNALAIKRDTIFAGTGTLYIGGGVFISSNSDSSWTPAGLASYPISALALRNDTVFAGTNDAGMWFRALNGGSWSLSSNGLIGSGTNIFSLALYENYIFAGTGNKVYYSNNIDSSWIALDSNLTSWDIYSLAVNNTYVFAGTENGIWRYPLSKITGIKEMNNNESNISNPYPNPTDYKTSIDYTLPPGINEGEIVFYNLQGTEVKRFKVDRTFSTLLISTADIAAGTYLYQLQTTAQSTEGKKMVVIK